MSDLTDKYRFLALVDEFGLVPEIETFDSDDYVHVTFNVDAPRVAGYANLLADFRFTPDGTFHSIVLAE